MSKFVIAGASDCPYFAKLELLAVQLSNNLPNFKFHKIVHSAPDWDKWLNEICETNAWQHNKSPIVWRELVERGGKGLLLGGFNEFMEYAEGYYGVSSDMQTELMLKIKDENIITKEKAIEEEIYIESLSKPIHICITNASNPVSPHIIPSIASGGIFGPGVEISIRLLDTIEVKTHLEGLAMEMTDLAYPLLRKVSVLCNAEEAFADASAVIILDSDDSAKKEDESHHDWISRNASLFQKYADTLNEVALPEVKVLLSGGGAVNSNAHVLIQNTRNLTKTNIVAISRLQERRARSILASKFDVNSADVKDLVVWGNCANDGDSGSVHLSVASGRVHNYDGAIVGPSWFSRSLLEIVQDNKWISTDFLSLYSERKSEIENILTHKTNMSEGASVASILRDWVQGASPDEIYSLGVECEGWYGVSDCVFSLPVRFLNGSYQVVWDLELDNDAKEALKKIELELKKDITVEYTLDVAEDEIPNEVFGEDSELISSMIAQHAESPIKTPGDKLEVIEEEAEVEDTAESPTAEE